MRMLLLKFVEETAEVKLEGEKDPREQAMAELSSIYERGRGVEKLHQFLTLTKSDILSLDFSAFIT